MFRKTVPIALALAAIANLAWGQAPGGSLGIYADLAGSSSQIKAPQFVPTEFYILGRPNVETLFGGLQGAEFRVKGAPWDDMLISPVPAPASNIALGNPFSDESQPEGSRGGCNIAFPVCQEPDALGFVLLFSVTVVDLSMATNVYLEVDRRDPPTNPTQQFPLFNACNPTGAGFTATEVDGLTAMINATTVAVQEQSWGSVKGLYR